MDTAKQLKKLQGVKNLLEAALKDVVEQINDMEKALLKSSTPAKKNGWDTRRANSAAQMEKFKKFYKEKGIIK